MRIQVLSAAIGQVVNPQPQQSLEHGFTTFTEADFPPNVNKSRRLQARIPKMFGWELLPGADVYVWIDNSFVFSSGYALEQIVSMLDACDLAVFRHPDRDTAHDEAAFIQKKLDAGSRYVRSRYEGEDLVGALCAISDEAFTDDTLFATMLVAYKPSERLRRAFTEWWVHTSRFHAVDQIALPFLCWKHHLSVATLPGNPYRTNDLIRYVR